LTQRLHVVLIWRLVEGRRLLPGAIREADLEPIQSPLRLFAGEAGVHDPIGLAHAVSHPVKPVHRVRLRIGLPLRRRRRRLIARD
jgi:hypothetical protein